MLLLQKCKETADARLIGVYSGYAALFPTTQEKFSPLRIPRMQRRAARRNARAFQHRGGPASPDCRPKIREPGGVFQKRVNEVGYGVLRRLLQGSAELASFPTSVSVATESDLSGTAAAPLRVESNAQNQNRKRDRRQPPQFCHRYHFLHDKLAPLRRLDLRNWDSAVAELAIEVFQATSTARQMKWFEKCPRLWRVRHHCN